MTRRLIWTLACLGALVLASASARAGSSRGGAFRHPGYGARVWGMGGAGVATVDDESAVYWNPAMLGLLGTNIVGASTINLVRGTTARQSQIVYARVLRPNEPHGNRPTARHAVGVLYTNLHLGLAESNSYDENLLRGVYAFTPDPFVSVGVSLEALHSKSDVAGFDAFGTTVGASLRIELTETMTLGLVARDLFSRYSYGDGGDYEKDRAWTVGLGYRGLGAVALAGDVVWAHGGLSRAVAGGETRYLLGHLALRAGWAYLRAGESRGVPHLGLGVRAVRERIHLHYNANLDDQAAFEDTHRFTLSVTL